MMIQISGKTDCLAQKVNFIKKLQTFNNNDRVRRRHVFKPRRVSKYIEIICTKFIFYIGFFIT